jgi:hypothetical protein
MPPMIAPWTEEALVDCSSDKSFINNVFCSHLFCLEHIV